MVQINIISDKLIVFCVNFVWQILI